MSEGNRRLEWLCVGAILVVQAILIGLYFVPTLGGVDCNGYHVCSRMIELHDRFYQVPEDQLSFVSRMWIVTDAGEYYPKYPPLYPLLAGAVLKVFGGWSGLLVTPVCMVLAVLGLYVACRTLLPGWAAVLAAFIGATTPLINAFANDQVSHGVSICCITWGYALFFRGTHGRERPCPGLMAASGLLLGYSIGARYPNALMTLPVLLWFWQHRRVVGWPGPIAWAIGAAIPCVFLALFHWVAFGSPLRTAYSYTDEQGAFSLGNLIRHLHFYVPSVIADGVGPIFWLFVCGYLVTWLRDRQKAWLYTVWMAPLTVLYMSYYFAPQHHPLGYLRFLLPLGIPCVILALTFLNELLSAIADVRVRRVAIAALVLCQGAWGVFSSLEQLEMRFRYNDSKYRRVELVRDNVPAGSVVFGEFELLDDLDYWQEYSLYWEMTLHQEKVASYFGSRDAGPNSLQKSRADAMRRLLIDVDAATFAQRATGLLDKVLGSGRAVYLVGPAEIMEGFGRDYGERYSLTEVAHDAGGVRRRLFAPGEPPQPELAAPYSIARIQPVP